MYIRPEQVLEKYELEVKSISRGRDGFVCETNQGQKLLKEYRGSMERAEFLMQIMSYIKENGILVETLNPTIEGAPVAVLEDESKYVLFDGYMGEECDTGKVEHMILAVKKLAELHNITERYQGFVPHFLCVNQNGVLDLYEKHNRELNKVKNYIRAKRKKNEFEMLFVQQYEPFMKKAVMVVKELQEMEPKEEGIGFCHGDFNQHNVVFVNGKSAILNFDHFGYQIRVGDLANFMRKMLEKNGWDSFIGEQLILAYDQERALSMQERNYLYLYLAYPEKFWKIANHYYNAHKAWVSGRNIEKLEKFIAQEKERERFLRRLKETFVS